MTLDCEGNIGETCSTPTPWQTHLGPVTWFIPVPNLHYRGGYRPMDGSRFNPDLSRRPPNSKPPQTQTEADQAMNRRLDIVAMVRATVRMVIVVEGGESNL